MTGSDAAAPDRLRVERWLAFAEDERGGSTAGVVMDASLDGEQMQRVAVAVGAPATAFVTAVSTSRVDVRFFSTRTEYGMCGHGTVAVLVALAEQGRIGDGVIDVRTGFNGGRAEVSRRDDGRHAVHLDLTVPPIERPTGDLTPIWNALGVSGRDPTISRSDFVHLLVPLELPVVAALTPDFERLGEACLVAGVDTVAAYSLGTVDQRADVHTRDFCPAVGTDEAAATGTTNRAVVADVIARDPERFSAGNHRLLVEQGIEMGRPSSVEVRFSMAEGSLETISVGGVATRQDEMSV